MHDPDIALASALLLLGGAAEGQAQSFLTKQVRFVKSGARAE
jgi:hypothetical protein